MQPTPSRRQVLQGCACLGLGGLLGGRWAGYAQAADKPPAAPAMQAHEAAPGCWYVEGLSALGSPANQNFISNAGFIVTSSSVVVIDALGSPALAERLLAEIARVTDKPVSHVIVTHYHADHVYGLQVFADRGIPILAHQAGREYLHADTARLRLEPLTQADAAGMGTTLMPRASASRTMTSPGSDTQGMPASLHKAQLSPASMRCKMASPFCKACS